MLKFINKIKDIIIEMSKKVNSLEEIKNMNFYLKEWIMHIMELKNITLQKKDC